MELPLSIQIILVSLILAIVNSHQEENRGSSSVSEQNRYYLERNEGSRGGLGIVEEEDDLGPALAFLSSGPNTETNGKSERKQGNMSFGEAVVLAKEEVQCLKEFGSQKTKTEKMNSMDRAIAQMVAIPYGCFNAETNAQCEQCRNITALPILGLKECQQLCNITDSFCNVTCMRVYEKLRNDSKGYNKDDVDSNDNKISASSRPRKLHLITKPHVFCEGVNYSEEKVRLGEKNQTHFVLLRWNLEQRKTGPESRVLTHFEGQERRPGNKLGDLPTNVPLVFVIEQRKENMSGWETIGKTPYGLQSVNVSYQSSKYTWRITAVGPQGIEDVAETEEYITLDGYKHPGPPKQIYVVDTEVENSSVSVLIGWEPPDEKACFYKIVLEGTSGRKTETVRIKDPLGVHRYWFDNLSFGTVYHVRMTSRNPSWKYESNLTKLEFKTPSCLESFQYRFDKCAPPRISESSIRAEIQIMKSDPSFVSGESHRQQIQVHLSWQAPLNASELNPIEKYLVEVSQFSLVHPSVLSKFNDTRNGNVSSVISLTKNYTVPGNVTQLVLKNLESDKEYTVMITAYSIRGGSPRAQYRLNTKLITAEVFQEVIGNWIIVTLIFGIAVGLLILCNVMRILVHKRNVKIARTKYFQSMEERDEMGADWSIVPLTEDNSNWKLFDENFPKEKWEICWDDLSMGEVIGQGAFGVVRRAKLHKKKLETKLKFRGEDETWFNSADRNIDEQDPEMETVAVKMVKVSSTRDDREQLIREITMMQSLGFHSQIVGLLGACTKGRTLCLVLEYCPGGDLLTFVRKVRAKYWPTLGLSQSNNSPLPLSGFGARGGITVGMKFCGRTTNSGSGTTGTGSDARKSMDSSPINYADIGGFSGSCSSADTSWPLFPDTDSRKDVGQGNSTKTDANSIPPFYSNQDVENMDDFGDEFRPIDEKDVLSYARQIAMGMEYLEKNRVVHRDLACRNVLLMGDYKHVKISDFGLSRDIYTWNVYHQKSNGKLPIKWMAIESIFTHVFTTKSDVWSYGILLWELVTLGGTPYPGLGNNELFQLLKSGYRMERPDNCSEELYAVMKKCWRTAAASRPSFTELRRHIETMMEAAEPNLYLSLMADIPVDYFQLSSRSDIPLVGKEDDQGQLSPLFHENTSFPSNQIMNRPIASTSFGSVRGNYSHDPITGAAKKVKGSTSSARSSRRTKSYSMYHNTMPQDPNSEVGNVPSYKEKERGSLLNGLQSPDSGILVNQRHNEEAANDVNPEDNLQLPADEKDLNLKEENDVFDSPLSNEPTGTETETPSSFESENCPRFSDLGQRNLNGVISSKKSSTSSSPSPISPTRISGPQPNDTQTGAQTKRVKLSLPFINVNDMTIIENKTYDLRDS